MRLKKICGRALLLATGFIIATIIGEILIRATQPLGIGPGYMTSPGGHRVYIGGYNGPFASGDARNARVEINNQGFHDFERILNKPNDSIRIAAVGDSFTAGVAVGKNETWTAILESLLRSKGFSNIAVLNFGIDGRGTVEEVKHLRDDLIAYQPDIVLLQFLTGNDAGDNYWEASGEMPPNVKTIESRGKLSKIIKPLLWRSQLYQFVVATTHRIYPVEMWLVRNGIITPPKEMTESGVRFEYLVYAEPQSLQRIDPRSFARYEKAWSATGEALRIFKGIGRENNFIPAIVLFPNRPEVLPEVWQQIQEDIPPMKSFQWNLELPRRKLTDISEQLGIAIFDTAPPLRTSADKSELYFREGHFTRTGHKAVAETIAPWVAELLQKL